MSNPSKRELVVQSLKTLHKARVRTLFRLKAIGRQRSDAANAYRAARQDLDAIQRKMTWEINTNGKILGERP